MNKHLKLSSHQIKDKPGIWWREVAQGIEIHIDAKSVSVLVFVIDWQTLRYAVKRKDRK